MIKSRLFGLPGLCLSTAVALTAALSTGSAQASDPISASPVTATDLAHKYLLLDTAKVGDRYLAIGDRGHVIYSDDGAKSWKQTTDVPAAVTLTAMDFADDKTGWLVGHDATIMKTEDGGLSWTKQYEDLYHEAPLLGIIALSADRAIAVGAYGKTLVTTDGGASWDDRLLYEEDDFHVSALIKARNGTIWGASEAGTLYRSLDNGDTFEPVESPYEGSFWGGLAMETGRVILFGMRGNVYYTDDGESWNRAETGTSQSLSGGTILSDGTIMIVGNGGVMLKSSNQGRSFDRLYQPDRVDLTDVGQGADGSIYMIGNKGVAIPSDKATKD